MAFGKRVASRRKENVRRAYPEEIKEAVRHRYASAARSVKIRKQASCCSDPGCCESKPQLYELKELQQLPEEAALASPAAATLHYLLS